MFFAVLIGAFAIGQAGPNLESLLTAAGASETVFDTVNRVGISLFALTKIGR